SVRNLGLEKIANTVRFPCKFASSGCPLFFYHFDKVEHEETCECRPYSCPCPGAACKWQGALNDVMDHLKKVHKSITTLQGRVTFSIPASILFQFVLILLIIWFYLRLKNAVHIVDLRK
ncbi:seven in absentia protein, partial [Teladorsagia circumcincta]